MQQIYSWNSEHSMKHRRSRAWLWYVLLAAWFFAAGLIVEHKALTPRYMPCSSLTSLDHLEEPTSTWYGLDKQGHACMYTGKEWVNTNR